MPVKAQRSERCVSTNFTIAAGVRVSYYCIRFSLSSVLLVPAVLGGGSMFYARFCSPNVL